MDSSSESDNENGVDSLLSCKTKVYRPRINFELDDFDFTARFRLSPSSIEKLIKDIGPYLEHDSLRNMALSPKQQILLAIRYLAGGGFMLTVGDAHGPSKSTVSRTVHSVVAAINLHYFNDIIKWPEDIASVVTTFYKMAGMPYCIGAIDGCHINIKTPSINENQFVNRHGQHSINTMMVAGPRYQFFYVSAKRPGSVNDARVLKLSTLARKFSQGWRPYPNGIILGDSGYGLSQWLIPPTLKAQLTPAEEKFNKSHRSTRRIIECSFGILKRRFACLNKLNLSPEFAADVIKACAMLHNISIDFEPITEDEIKEVLTEIECKETELQDIDSDELDNDDTTGLGDKRRKLLVSFFE